VVRSALGFAAAALLAACATLSEAPIRSGGFELSGRVVVHYAKEALSGRIFWRHSDDAEELLITSPLGQGLARITRTRGGFLLVAGDGREYRAADTESLTEEALGWRLPLAGLADWVRGHPSPGSPYETIGGAGREFRQDGWRVAYEEIRDGQLPRLRLTREGLEIRLIVDQWKN
jgi:outer membrane lipoprotein LolB